MQDLMIGRAKKAGFLALVWAISVVVLIATKGSNGTETTWDGLQALNDPRAMQIKDSLMNGMVPADSGLQGKYNLEGAICKRNPFLASIKLSETEMLSKYDSLVKQTAWDREQITLDPQTKHNHNRFRPFHTAVDCNPTCVGGECGSDTSKIVCGLNTLRSPCVVYSIGSNNDWSFELGVLKSTSCEVHTFDCTGDRSRFKVPPSNRLFFHYECLGTSSDKNFYTLDQLAERHSHKQIDLLKMDIEGFEFDAFDSILSSADLFSAPMQILVEVHYRSQMGFPGTVVNGRVVDWKHEIDLFNLNLSLLKAGYIVANRDDNVRCPHCSELTLLRLLC